MRPPDRGERGAPAAPRMGPRPSSPEALTRGVVADIQDAGDAKVERLCDAMRQAIELLLSAMTHSSAYANGGWARGPSRRRHHRPCPPHAII